MNRVTRGAFAAVTAALLALPLSATAYAEQKGGGEGTAPDKTKTPISTVDPGASDKKATPLVPIAAPAGSVIDVAVLPLFGEARWQPVPNWGWGSPFLTGVEVCSPNGIPPEGFIPPPPSSDTQHAVLVPGDGGNPQGWTATVSFAPYASLQDSVNALHSYKTYVEACPEANRNAKVQNNSGIARNDPSSAHGVVVTNGHFMSLFATALGNGVVELALTRPAGDSQVELGYSPSSVIAALRGANPRP